MNDTFVDSFIELLEAPNRKNVRLSTVAVMTVLISKAKLKIDRRARFMQIAMIFTE
jgi:hypothetical protein